MNELSETLGPIGYLIVEWPDRQPQGEALPHLIDLVDRGIIHILDLAMLQKADDGTITRIEVADLGDSYAVFEGVSSGVIGDDDIEQAGEALEPGTTAALLIYENRWAAPFAAALRGSGAQLVAAGFIPMQAIVDSLEAAETV